MKRFLGIIALALICAINGIGGLAAQAAPIGKATADFDNARPDKGETAWGRLAADAVRTAARADIALINAGALQNGALKAGSIEPANINSLLAFGDDAIVLVKLTGEQLRAGLELAAQSYPTGSAAFLQCSGFTATFDPKAARNHRVTSVRFQGREVAAGDSITAAMPVSLANGANGFFRVWKADGAMRSGATLRSAITDFIRAKGEVSPDGAARFAPQ